MDYVKFLSFVLILSMYSQYSSEQKSIVLPRIDYYLTSKDHSRNAILQFDINRDYTIFGKNAKPATLSNSEITNIEKMIKKRVLEFNEHAKHSKVNFGLIKKPEKYFKQLIAVENSKGEKEVWVNCCCSVMHNYWKTHIQITEDGGSCYFQLKINLTNNLLYDFSVNGVA